GRPSSRSIRSGPGSRERCSARSREVRRAPPTPTRAGCASSCVPLVQVADSRASLQPEPLLKPRNALLERLTLRRREVRSGGAGARGRRDGQPLAFDAALEVLPGTLRSFGELRIRRASLPRVGGRVAGRCAGGLVVGA